MKASSKHGLLLLPWRERAGARRKRRHIVALFLAAAVLLCACVPVWAGAYLYAGKRKHIYCGVVAVADSVPADLDAGGRMLFLLDARTDVKPTGWNFENPYAPGSAATGLGKSDPAYWVVNLSVVRDLSRMHMLYLPLSGIVKLDDQDREKLRRFVDGGGVLWIDNTASLGSLDFDDTFFITRFEFHSASGGYDIAVNRHHPVLTLPYWLSPGEVGALGANAGKYDCNPGYVAGGWGSLGSEPTCFDVLLPIVNNSSSGKPSVAANSYGSGRIVATANFVGKGCLLGFGYDTPSMKFAYNVVSWSSAYNTLRKDPRHTGSAIDTVGGTQLVEQWNLEGVQPLPEAESSPVIYKNVAFYSGMLGGVSTLFAVDLLPYEDLDQDGDTDDGLLGTAGLWGADAPRGVDLIWYFQESEGAKLSSPTIATVQNPTNPEATVEAVLVASSAGRIHVLSAFPDVNLDGILDNFPNPPPIIPPYSLPGGGLDQNLSPPLIVNGWIYAINRDGRLCAYNPSLAAWGAANNTTVVDHWEVPSVLDAGFTGVQVRSGPSFAFVRSQSSGAVVGVVYWFLSPPRPPGAVAPENNDHVYGVPVFASNDRLRVRSNDSTGLLTELQITYREGNISLTPRPVLWYRTLGGARVTIPDANIEPNRGLIGGAMSPANKPGSIVVNGFPIPADATVYATYALDYAYSGTGAVVIVQPRVRAALEPRSNEANQVPPTEIASTPALGPDNLMFVTGTRQCDNLQGGGSVYGLANDGNTQATNWHYFLHSGCEMPAGLSGAVAEIPGVVELYPKDANNMPLPPLVMHNPQPHSSPVYAGDKVFVAVTGNGNPAGAILCFKANSDFVIRITESGGYGKGGHIIRRAKKLYSEVHNRKMSVKLWQPNLLMPPGGLDIQPLMASIPVPSNMIDYDRGTITFDNFDRLHLRGTGANFMQTNTFSPSLPVAVFVDNVEVPIDWSTWAPSVRLTAASGQTIAPAQGDAVDLSGWNNLLWYYVVPDYSGQPCTGIHSSPVVIGNAVYFITDDGILYALNAETGETLGGPIDAKNVIWQTKVGTLPLPFDSNVSIAGANGVLLVPAGDGLHAFGNSTTLVADNNRVVELDGAGEVAWALDSVTWPVSAPSGNQPPTVRASPVNKPARVRYVGAGDMLVVNSGANHVYRVSKDGRVGINGPFAGEKYIRWMVERFCDPKRLLRPGQPTTLTGPTDALLWEEMDPDGWLSVHCLIADSGNHRVLDLAYRLRGNELSPLCERDPASGFWLPYLNWVSRTESMNQRYIFDCIQLVEGKQIWAAISNYATGTEMAGGPPLGERGLGGAIVALDYRSQNSDGTWIYGDADPSSTFGEIIARCDRVNWGGGPKPLANPRFFQVIDKPDGRHMLICDNHGVYEVMLPSTDVVAGRVLLDMDYRGLPREILNESTGTVLARESIRAPLLATSVQELANGHWLISNGYSGPVPTSGQNFGGEVFQYDPEGKEIVWSSPMLAAPDAASPWRQKLKNSNILEQPRSALRQF